MTASRRTRSRTNDANKASAPEVQQKTSAAAVEAGKVSDRTKKATSRIFLILRIILFALACIFAVLGVKGFIDISSTQTTSRTVASESIKADAARHACVIFSYDDADANVQYERTGAVGLLNKSGVSTDVFYLDARSTFNDEEALKRFDETIKEKAIAAGGYDVIVVAGNEALSYIMKHQTLFGGIPVSFFAVDDRELAKSAYDKGVGAGFYEDGAASTSLNSVAKLLPKASNVVVLTDGSLESDGMLAQLKADSNVTSQVKQDVWDVSKKTRDKLAEDLADLDSDTFVLLLAANHDKDGNVYTPSETAYFLAKNAKVPVFAAIGNVGEGVCGAAFIDRQSEGENAARLAIEFVNGEKVKSKENTTVKPDCMVYDVQALEAHGINPDSTGDQATLINEPTFSWRVIRPMIQPALFMLIAIVCIAGFGIIGFRRSIQSNRALIASRNDLQYRLYHDLLTDLPNRHALEQLANEGEGDKKMMSLVQIDIDDFTDINDSYGHAFGDEIIKIVGARLRGVRALQLARSGGDEFTLAFDHTLNEKSGEFGQIARIFNDPVVVGDSRLDLSASIGVSNLEEGMSGEDLIIFSDLAIHTAKEGKIHAPVFYSAEMRESMEKKLEITEYLKQAIAEESINVVWQPQVDTMTLKVYGWEALCRLEGNAYYPGDFIPVAEMSGLVVPIGRIVTKKVVTEMGKWLKEGREVGIASINYSAAQLRDKDYCNFLADLLAEHNVPASLIKIEITESMILGNEEDATRLFSRLRSMGVTLALDDFGTGYSSLYRMASRPVDVVKLDKSLVDTFMVPGKEGFIDDVTRLIHGIDKEIVVEGVETMEQFEMCQRFGCDIIQGYFFSRPVSAQEAVDFDPTTIVPEAKAVSNSNGKARNADWETYDRDANGRWKKKDK